MRDEEHYVQDTLEVYAVARLQQLAQEARLAITADANLKMQAFRNYAAGHGFTEDVFVVGRWRVYKATYDRHLPVFFSRLAEKFPGKLFDFTNTEVANRNAQLKGDFLITMSPSGTSLSVSLKNYRNGAKRPQLNSGTYNSFILNFLFESPSVGTFADPKTRGTFRSTPAAERNEALTRNGYGAIVEYMAQMDLLNKRIRARFIDTPEFEMLDEAVFDRARKQCGELGANLAATILTHIDPARLKARALKMVGMDGIEEMLIMDPDLFSDTITDPVFAALRHSLHDPDCVVVPARKGQGLAMDFVKGVRTLLEVTVPFTINKNGAWISGDSYAGTRYHEKEGVRLAYGQRRPKKSRELATSINTYVNFGATGIFDARVAR